MSEQPLWRPSPARIEAANITRFQREKLKHYLPADASYTALHQWSVDHPDEFWQAILTWGKVQYSGHYEHVLTLGEHFIDSRWFEGMQLNFAENLLRRRDDHPALIAYLENGERRQLSYNDLYAQASSLAQALKAMGVKPGDRVAAWTPNVPETVVGMLAAVSLGATWSSCSPDFGVNGVFDRFGQIEPKVLFASDGYYYNGKTIDCRPRLQDIVARIDSLEHVIMINTVGLGTLDNPKVSLFSDCLQQYPAGEIDFVHMPFNHPLYIMYSSGTTGKPKCIVHGAGGTLLQHIKEHSLHSDLKPEDVLFYFTTCGWMMWNWLVSGLAQGATLVLYDGSPFYPDAKALLDIAERERFTIFGTSAKYIAALEKEGLVPRESHDLSSVKTIMSTGSPLSHESFRYIYRDVKQDVCLSSISGGTDILSCFVPGNPTLPVWEGEIQCKGLGMAVACWNDEGVHVVGEKAELVCTAPFPSMPIGFWNDPENSRFLEAYFSRFPNVWAQGDFAEETHHQGMIIHGRSDAILNPGGVRIGTAEIYRQVQKVEEVIDSLCIGQDWADDVRVVLFVMLRQGVVLDVALRTKICQTIRAETTPRHVPAKIIAVADIPRTISGKIVELAVRNVVHGLPVKNTEALANPEALEHYKNLPELAEP
ncbi:MAG TPA: acetoacetate--CoA ligase [Pseudomonadales bacterium]|nr:acetoacetate--CoA ligase [Pseudomonadales bacterium]